MTILGLFLDGGVITALQDISLPKQMAGWISAAPCFLPNLSGGILLVRERKMDGSWRGQGYRQELFGQERVKCKRGSLGLFRLPNLLFHKALPSQTGHIASYQ